VLCVLLLLLLFLLGRRVAAIDALRPRKTQAGGALTVAVAVVGRGRRLLRKQQRGALRRRRLRSRVRG
jgi:hypothetical protein